MKLTYGGSSFQSPCGEKVSGKVGIQEKVIPHSVVSIPLRGKGKRKGLNSDQKLDLRIVSIPLRGKGKRKD